MDSNLGESSLKAGALFANRYSIQRLIGLGGMGEVYLALDTLLNNEPIALKIIHEDLSKEERNVKRFQREIQLTRKVAHGNIARTFDAGISNGRFFFSMEYLEGTVISDMLKGGAIPYYEACRILQQICEGLDAIHKEGIVHRDLKPGNLILMPNGTVKITDFGIARPGNSDLTRSSEVLGSAPYMAPELWTGTEVGTPSDIYALGALFYEMLTGVMPLDGDTAAELMFKHLEVLPPRPSSLEVTVPPWLDQIVLDLLAKRAGDRPKTGQEISLNIERHLTAQEQAPIIDAEVAPSPEVEREQLKIVGFLKEIPTGVLPSITVERASDAQMSKKNSLENGNLYIEAVVGVFSSAVMVVAVWWVMQSLIEPFLIDVLRTARVPEFRYLRIFVTLAMIISAAMITALPMYASVAPLRKVWNGPFHYLTITTRMSIAMALLLIGAIALYFRSAGIDLHAGIGPQILVLTRNVFRVSGELFLLLPVANVTTFSLDAKELLIGVSSEWTFLAMLCIKVSFTGVCVAYVDHCARAIGCSLNRTAMIASTLLLTTMMIGESFILASEAVRSGYAVQLFKADMFELTYPLAQIVCGIVNWMFLGLIAIVLWAKRVRAR